MGAINSIDVVMVSNAKNSHFRFLAEQTIYTAIDKESNWNVNVIVVEKQHIEYNRAAITLSQDEPFNYNACLIKGANSGTSEYIFFANNDLVFGHNWATNLIEAMIENNSRSACPYSEISHKENKTNLTKAKEIYEGYEIRKEFCGWAFCWKRDLFEELSLDTRVSFWCSDDATAEQLKMKNEKHILVTKSIVDHYENGSKTLYSMDNNTIHNLTTEQFIKFKQLYNK